MPCWVKLYVHIAEFDLFAIRNRLSGTGEIFAIAQGHDGERIGRRQHGTMAGAGMVGMAMRDQGPRDGAHRIDVDIGLRAIEAHGREGENIGDSHSLLM